MPIIFFTYLVPSLIAMVLFIRSYRRYSHIYWQKKKPNFPLLPRDMPEYLEKGSKVPFPLIPFMMWKIVFERHQDQELDQAARHSRQMFVVMLLVMVSNFILHVLANEFGLIQ